MGYLILAINLIFTFFYVILVARSILPRLPRYRNKWPARALYDLTDPWLNVIRLGLPPEKIGFDAAPFIGLILLWLLQGFIVNYLLGG
ncbi:MAG: YggT family protein [Candidatus Margulisiibacteriota bacterium]